MNDSADIRMAADRLASALKSLEGKLDPILSRLDTLETRVKEADSFETDRSELAQKLDAATARESELKEKQENYETQQQEFDARQKEFSALAEETTQELDRVIGQVKKALGRNNLPEGLTDTSGGED